MFSKILASFSDELLKIAVDVSKKVDRHFSSESKDWGTFDKNLKVKSFQKAVSDDPRADEKLRSYVKNLGDYKTSKSVVAKVPSRTSGKQYVVKRLESGRLGCSCKDWQYKHSHQGTDCDHIYSLKAKKKVAAPNYFAQGAWLAAQHGRIKNIKAQNEQVKPVLRQLRQTYRDQRNG